jgi:hypothetical protein
MATTAKTDKRFQTTEIVVYRKSNTTRIVSFDTFDEAKAVIEEQRKKTPTKQEIQRLCI